jgi:CheY-like chemotaxis protein
VSDYGTSGALTAGMAKTNRRQCLLIVDDELAVRSVMCRLIRSAFADVELREAADGEAALDLLDDDVTCIIADIDMPKLDGLRLCWTIRNTQPFRPWREVPVILVSALYREEEALERAWGSGTALFLRKPFEVSELARLISRSTGLEPAARAA